MTGRRSISWLLPVMVIAAALGALADDFAIDWHQLGRGGGTSANDEFNVSGVIGDVVAGEPATSEEFTVTGGLGVVIALANESAPPLGVTSAADGTVRVYWPLPDLGWELRQSSGLEGANWEKAPEPRQDNGTIRFITITPTAARTFYRLFAFDPTAADQDGDGMSDAFETLHGFDPSDPDQNRNGVADGQEDADGDGVPNALEMRLGLNPRDAITFPPTRDNELDRDGDHLTDGREVQLGTDWLKDDTDGDLFTDDAELLVGKDPLNPRSYPLGVRFAPPVETLHRRLSGPGSPPATVVAQPPVEVFAPGRAEGAPPPFHFAFPPVEVRDEPTP